MILRANIEYGSDRQTYNVAFGFFLKTKSILKDDNGYWSSGFSGGICSGSWGMNRRYSYGINQ